jgi:hypothetical protein
MDAIDKASWACQEIHDGSTTDELVKILLNLTFHSAVTSAIERFVFLTYIIASTLQVQTTTPLFKSTEKNIENTYKTDKYMQKLPREKHVEVKYSLGSIFFHCRWLIDYSISFQYHTDTDIVIINLTAVSLHPHDTGM